MTVIATNYFPGIYRSQSCRHDFLGAARAGISRYILALLTAGPYY